MNMNCFSNTVSNALESIEELAGEKMDVYRGDTFYQVVMIPTKSIHSSSDNQGYQIRFASKDFLISKKDYPFNEPEEGDLIKWKNNSELVTYKVQTPAGEAEHFRYQDSAETRYRIHATEYKRERL